MPGMEDALKGINEKLQKEMEEEQSAAGVYEEGQDDDAEGFEGDAGDAGEDGQSRDDSGGGSSEDDSSDGDEREEDDFELLDGFEAGDSGSEDDGGEEVDYGEHTEYVSSLKEKIKELEEKTSASSYKTKIGEAIDRIAASGRKIDESVIKYQSIDFDKVDIKNPDTAKMVLVEDMVVNQGIDPKIAERLVNKEFKDISEFEPGDDEYEDAYASLNVKSKKSLDSLKEYQRSIALPLGEDEREMEKARLEQEEEDHRYIESAKGALGKIKGVDIQVGDKVIRYKGDAERVKDVHEIMTNPEAQENFFQDNFVNEDGSYKFDEMYRMLMFAKHHDILPKLFINQGIAIGKKKAIQEELNNADSSGKGRGSSKGGMKKYEDMTDAELLASQQSVIIGKK